MASFEIDWRNSTRKDLRGLPPQVVPRIVAAVVELADEPFPPGSQKLTGSEHTYRIRIGGYRVVYEILADARRIVVNRVRHRKDVYR
jgi:mRNA interferase RelE/StbE